MSQRTLNDAELVTAFRAGDRSALAEIYDRYGTSLYDTAAVMTRTRDDAADITQDVFVIAAERIEQLRDPSRLKPWLFAILRNEVYRRTGKNKRVVVTDFTEPSADMQLPHDPADEASAAEYEELASLVRGAAAGLDERDQLVLELSVRQGLTGDDLADALGVSAQQSYGMLHRMRQRTERSLGAYCVARKGRKECSELDGILRGWDGDFSVLIRKRVARHVEACDICERNRRKFVPLALYGAAPAFAAPADLRDRVLAATGAGGPPPAYGFSAPGGFPAVIKYGRRLGLWFLLGTVALLVATGTTAYVIAADDGPDEPGAIAAATTTTTSPGTEVSVTTSADPTTPSTTTVDQAAAGPTSTTSAPTTSSSSTTTAPGSSTSTSSTVASAVPVTVVVTASTIPSATTVPATTTTTPTPTTTIPTPTTTIAATTTTTTAAPTPGSLSLSAGTIAFGTTLDQVTLTLSNPGGQPVSWAAGSGPTGFRGTASAFSFAPKSGNLAPGASVKVTFAIDRTWPAEGTLRGETVQFFSAGDATQVSLTGTIARPPVLRVVGAPPAFECQKSSNGLFWEAQVADESLPLRVVVDVTYPGGGVVRDTMEEDSPSWYGGLNGDGNGDQVIDAGIFSWVVRATDAFGNTSTVSGQTSVGTDNNHC